MAASMLAAAEDGRLESALSVEQRRQDIEPWSFLYQTFACFMFSWGLVRASVQLELMNRAFGISRRSCTN